MACASSRRPTSSFTPPRTCSPTAISPAGFRNLWDIDRLLRQFAADPAFWPALAARAAHHQLRPHVARALRLSARLYGTPVDAALAGRARLSDRLFEARLLARNGWGQETRKALRFAFYVRSHWLRMPPLMLARHLWTKARPGTGISRRSMPSASRV